MRKNKYSQNMKHPDTLKHNGKGKEIYIDLQQSVQKHLNNHNHTQNRSTVYHKNIDLTQRGDPSPTSGWHHNASLSTNIIKEIISYSNLPSANTSRAKKNSTIAVYEKCSQEDINRGLTYMTYSNNHDHKQSKKLIIDNTKLAQLNGEVQIMKKQVARCIHLSQQLHSQKSQLNPQDYNHLNSQEYSNSNHKQQQYHQNSHHKSQQYSQRMPHDKNNVLPPYDNTKRVLKYDGQQNKGNNYQCQGQNNMSCSSSQKHNRTDISKRRNANSQRTSICSMKMPQVEEDCTYKNYNQLAKLKEAYAIRIDQLQIVQETFHKQFADVIDNWKHIIIFDEEINRHKLQLQRININIDQQNQTLQKQQERLLQANLEFVNTRKLHQYKSTGCQQKVLADAEKAHQELLRRLTIKDFAEVVMFNLKVALPMHQGDDSMGNIYEELFRNKASRKFTMILKKHMNQMDLYDSRMLSEYTKRITYLETQFLRSQAIASQSICDTQYYAQIVSIVERVQEEKAQQDLLRKAKAETTQGLQQIQDQHHACVRTISIHLSLVNKQVKTDYETFTDQEADFKCLLEEKYDRKYKEFKQVVLEKQKIIKDAAKNSQKMDSMANALFH